jgi:hypothetical protein
LRGGLEPITDLAFGAFHGHLKTVQLSLNIRRAPDLQFHLTPLALQLDDLPVDDPPEVLDSRLELVLEGHCRKKVSQLVATRLYLFAHA